MTFTVHPPSGDPYPFEVVPGLMSDIVCGSILTGHTYPALPFVGDVRVILDAGANCGAASVYFAQHFPDATVHAVEPASEPLAYLRRNVRRLPNVVVHPIGLHTEDSELPLYHGSVDTGSASIIKNDWNAETNEVITLRSAAVWVREQRIDRIDVLKVDVELSEYEVFASLVDFLPEVKVAYFEYGSREIRRGIDKLLDPTHDLYLGSLSLDQGEVAYVRRDLAALPEARSCLWQIFVERHLAAANSA